MSLYGKWTNTVKYPSIEVIIYQLNALKPYKTNKYIFINISENTVSRNKRNRRS
jgi:hypothetical protein